MADRQNKNGYFSDGEKNAASRKNTGAPANRNARPVMNDRQRALYEKAYYEKYGRSPYVNGQKNARQDRRQAFLEDERERRIKEAAARRRAEEERLRREAEAAALAAKREAKRRRELERELAVRRRESENLESYKSKRRQLERERLQEERARRRAEEARLEKLRRRRHRIRAAKFHAKVFAAALVVFLGLFTLVVYNHFYTDRTDPSRRVSYYFDGEKAYSESKDIAYIDGGIRLNFTDVAERYGFYTTGDSRSLKYIIPSDDGEGYDSIEFDLDSTTAFVNGTPVSLDAKSSYVDSCLWVSCSIGDIFESGITVKCPSAGTVRVERIKSKDKNDKYIKDDDGNYVYDKIVLGFKPMALTERIDLVALYGDDAKGLGRGSEVTFMSDLSAYENYMNPPDSNEFLVLVNKDNLLDVTYVPDDLTDVEATRRDGRAMQRMRLYAEKSLEAMFIEMKAAGFDGVSVTSAFVSYNEQANYYAECVNKEMADHGYTEAEAKTAVASYADEAGASDMQTGLSAVLHNLPEASNNFASEAVYSWLVDNSWKFGFILRYPDDKKDITAHPFDACHFRYVGRFAAESMHKNGLCLEEYLLGSSN